MDSKKVSTYKGIESIKIKIYKYKIENFKEKIKYKTEEFYIDSMQCLNMNDLDDANQKVIIYVYGSAYFRLPEKLHFNTVGKLIKYTNAKVIFPNYRKAYSHNYKQVLEHFEIMYKQVLEKTRPENIYLMGDSSGGGLALAFAKYLRNNNIPQPKKLFLFSPWVDVSLTNKEYKKYEKEEAYLDAKRLRDMGELWADGKANMKNAYASPIYGNLKNLPHITIFTGTREIFYPDIVKFSKKLEKLKIEHEIITCKKMIHAYFVFPIREARIARKYVAKKILED